MSNFLFCAKIKNFCGARKFLDWGARNFTYKCKKKKKRKKLGICSKIYTKRKNFPHIVEREKREKGKIFQKRKLDPLV